MILLTAGPFGYAQWVKVDPAYPSGSGPDNAVEAIANEPDGRVLIGGLFTHVSGAPQAHLARLDTNGVLDVTFHPWIDRTVYDIQVLPRGRIFISGSFTRVDGASRPGIARLLEDGSLDSSFDPSEASVAGVPLSGTVAPDGSVYVTGDFTTLGGLPLNHIAHILEDGSIDAAFHSPFPPTGSISVVAVQADGQPLVAGTFTNVGGFSLTNLVRLNLDGSVDPTFQSGVIGNQHVLRAVVEPDGRLVAVVAYTTFLRLVISPEHLVRLNADGSIDPSFDVRLDSPELGFGGRVYSVAAEADGEILLTGDFLRVNGFPHADIARIGADGTLDYCFGVPLVGGLLLAGASEADGSVLVGGSFGTVGGQWHPNLLRLLPSSGCEPGIIEMGTPSIAVGEDESEVVAPVIRHGGADLDQTVVFTTHPGSAKGGLDFQAVQGTVHFAPGERSECIRVPLLHSEAPTNLATFDIVLEGAGGGATLGSLTNTAVAIVRRPPGTAGAPDTNFAVQIDGPVQAIVPLADGGSAIAGSFTNVNGQPCPNVARLRADGTRDPGFSLSQPLDGELQAIARDRQGRLLLAGSFVHVDGLSRPGLARVGTDGRLDATFNPLAPWASGIYGEPQMESVVVLADSNIVCSGAVPLSDHSRQWVLLKISPSGDLDHAFTNRLPPGVSAASLWPLTNGDFFVQGGGLPGSIVRLHPDGTIDLGFVPPVDHYFVPASRDFGMLPDGRMVLSSGLNAYHGLRGLPLLSRLNRDGSLDNGFAAPPTYGTMGQISVVEVLSAAADGRVLFGAAFFGLTHMIPGLVRLHADGSLDLSFDQGSGLQPRPSALGRVAMNALEELPGGGWLLGGDFGAYDGFEQSYLVKILPETVSRPVGFEFAANQATVSETNGTITLEVLRRGDASGAAAVTLRTEDGTAIGGEDFTPLNVRLYFAPGEWSQTVTIHILDDRRVDGSQLFRVRLTDPTGGIVLPSSSTVAVTVRDDDTGVQFTTNQFHAFEEDGFAMAAVQWSGVVLSNRQAVVNIVPVTGRAEDLGASSVMIRAHSGTNWFRIPIVGDGLHEPTREFRLELAGDARVIPGPTATATLVIDDKDFGNNPARGVGGVVEAMAPAPGGRLYLAGDFTGVHGTPLNRVARLLPDGEVDPDFNPGPGPDADVTALAVQPADGKVLIAGDFTEVDGVPRAGLARLESDGLLDTSFDPGLGAQNTNGTPSIRVILPEQDGSVYLAGAFTHFNGYFSQGVVKLRPNGVPDDSFRSPFVGPVSFSGRTPIYTWPNPSPTTAIAASGVSSLMRQPDGKLVAAFWEDVEEYRATMRTAWIARLKATGLPDDSFRIVHADTLSLGGVFDLAPATAGSIIVGASAGTYMWSPGGVGNRTNWVGILKLTTNGVVDAQFQVEGAPSIGFHTSQVRQLFVQPDGRILFSAAVHSGVGPLVPDRSIIGRLLSDGRWDDSFKPLTCALPLLQGLGPFWFNDPSAIYPPIEENPSRPAPTASFASNPNGVLVLAGAFDSVNGTPRRRLARANPDGTLRGRLVLRLAAGPTMRLLLPAEVETPYVIETSPDLEHWSAWLTDEDPWWPAEIWLGTNNPARFFRARPLSPP